MRSTRRIISSAARREKVSSRMPAGIGALGDELRDAVRQRAGLARAGAGDHQQRVMVCCAAGDLTGARCRKWRRALCLVELCQRIGGSARLLSSRVAHRRKDVDWWLTPDAFAGVASDSQRWNRVGWRASFRHARTRVILALSTGNLARGARSKGIASLVPIDDNAGDAPGGMVTESGRGVLPARRHGQKRAGSGSSGRLASTTGDGGQSSACDGWRQGVAMKGKPQWLDAGG
jgi:hypothetical protein